jgi:hypothetical protein
LCSLSLAPRSRPRYQRLLDAEHRLSSLSSSVGSIIADLNASSERSAAEGSLGQVVQILPAHYAPLGFLAWGAAGVARVIAGMGGGGRKAVKQ